MSTMINVQIRKQGGAAVMTIPANILKILNIDVGATLELDVTKQGFMASPVRNSMRKRYTLAELLKGATPKKMKALNQKTKWALAGKPVGRELA
jgi:antitoxin ChpS